MRKFSWILALLAALAMVFIGCGESGGGGGGPGEDRVMTDVFDLQAYFAENEIVVGATRAQIFGDERFMCGADSDGAEMTYAIINEDSVLKLKFTTGASWAGIDLKHQGMQFYAGDELYIKGYVVTETDIFLNINNNGETTLGAWKPKLDADAEFEQTFVLTAAEVTAIVNNAWVPGIRIRTGAAKTVVIEQITLKGLRIAGYVPCECCEDSGTCLDAETCDGECCCELCLGSCAGCEIPEPPLPGYGDYVIPSGAAAGSFYLDLNEASVLQVAGGGLSAPETAPDVTISATKVTVVFDKIHHRVGFDLPAAKAAEVRAAIAGAANGGSVTVKIVGTASAAGRTRVGFGDPTLTGSWNGTNLPAGIFAEGAFDVTINTGFAPAQNSGGATLYNAFFLQARNAEGNAAASDEIDFTLEIASILVTVVPPEEVPPSCTFCGVPEATGCDCVILTGNLTTPFQRAGAIIAAVVDNGLGIKFGESWSGLDFKFTFQEGDVLKVKATTIGGAAIGSAELMLQVNSGSSVAWGDQQIGTPALGTDAEITIDATKLAIIESTAGSPVGGIRFRLNNAGSLTGFVLESLVVERADSSVFDLADWLED